MEMVGERRIPAPRQVVWQALNDLAVLRASIPGCESLERQSDTEMRATAAVKIGPISARFNGIVQLSEIEAPRGYTISGEGQGGVAGFAKGGAKVSLEDEGDGTTLLTYVVNAQVGGKIAQLGARLVDASAKQMADQFFSRFSAQLTPADSSAGSGDTPDGKSEPEPETETDAASRSTTFPAITAQRTSPTGENHSRIFPSAPGSAVADPILPPSEPASAISIFALIPREPFGFPLSAWIGGAIFLAILLLYIVSIA